MINNPQVYPPPCETPNVIVFFFCAREWLKVDFYICDKFEELQFYCERFSNNNPRGCLSQGTFPKGMPLGKASSKDPRDSLGDSLPKGCPWHGTLGKTAELRNAYANKSSKGDA